MILLSVMKPPLKSLHPAQSLSKAKLETLRKSSSDELVESLRPGQPGSLKVKADGTLMDGHHRVEVLRERGYDVDELEREVVGDE